MKAQLNSIMFFDLNFNSTLDLSVQKHIFQEVLIFVSSLNIKIKLVQSPSDGRFMYSTIKLAKCFKIVGDYLKHLAFCSWAEQSLMFSTCQLISGWRTG